MLDIEIENDSNNETEFYVTIDGPGLNGPPKFIIPPYETSKYELFIFGIKQGIFVGTLHFQNKFTEYVYDIHLHVEYGETLEKHTIEASIGLPKSIDI